MDLEIANHVYKRKQKLGLITPEDLIREQNKLLESWQARYITTDKGK